MSRRLVVFNQVSADGFFAGKRGGLDWVVSDDELGREAVAAMGATAGIVLGRHTYEQFAAFWPTFAANPRPPHGPHAADSLHAMARWLNETPKLVASRTLDRADWQGSRIVRGLDEIAAAKAERGGDLIAFGSGALCAGLAERGLIDELQLVVIPVLLGEGRSLFSGLPKRLGLRLIEAKGYRSGNVKLRYAPA